MSRSIGSSSGMSSSSNGNSNGSSSSSSSTSNGNSKGSSNTRAITAIPKRKSMAQCIIQVFSFKRKTSY